MKSWNEEYEMIQINITELLHRGYISVIVINLCNLYIHKYLDDFITKHISSLSPDKRMIQTENYHFCQIHHTNYIS